MKTRSWLDTDGVDDHSDGLQYFVEFLLENMNQASRTLSWTDLSADELDKLLFQRRVDSVSYKIKVNSGPVKTNTPQSKPHAKKERKRRSHQRGILEVTDLTTSEFVRDVSNRYIECMKEKQELELQQEAVEEGETYVSRTRSGNLSRRSLTKAPNKDEVHVRGLFTSLLSGLLYKHQLNREQDVRQENAELREDNELLKARISVLEKSSGRQSVHPREHKLPDIRVDTTLVHRQHVAQSSFSPSHALKSIESLQTARRPFERDHPEVESYMMDSKICHFGLPSPVPSTNSSLQSSFSSDY